MITMTSAPSRRTALTFKALATTHYSEPVTLVFPVYNPAIFDKSVQVILSAYAGSRRPDRVVVVDNSDGALFERYYMGADPERPNNFPPIEVISFGKNIGLPATWNYALSRFGDWLVLPGDDVVFHTHTLEGMVATAQQNSAAMIVYPANITDPADLSMSPWSFFLQRRELAERIGLYDEAFWPVYFADNDYAYRMRLAGLDPATSIVGAPVTAGHWGSATLKASQGAQLQRHHETFRKCEQHYLSKWGGRPGSEAYTAPFNRHNPSFV